MEATTCRHKEEVTSLSHGVQKGTCAICGQERQYPADSKRVPQVTKLGHIAGRVVIPAAGDILLIPEEEKVELKNATIVEPGPAEPPKPRRRKKLRDKKANKELEKNKEEIIKDYYSMTIRAFFKKWHISTKHWMRLREKWSVTRKNDLAKKKQTNAPRQPDIKTSGQLPPFPEFNDSWLAEVQVEWLKTYKELHPAIREGK